MGWSQIPPPKPTPAGAWEQFSYGADYHGWILRCGPAFVVHITNGAGAFYTTFDGQSRPVQKHLQTAQTLAEEEIINSVRTMLPAYKVIFDRVKARAVVQKATENVVSIRPGNEPG